MSWIRRHLVSLILYGISLIGAGLIAYPTFSDWWNSFHQSRAIISYMDEVAQMDEKQYEEVLRAAREYNAKLAKNGIRWILEDDEKKRYNEQLNVTSSGSMGYIQIQKINVMLPVYHGTGESVLQTCIGHLEGTSLPVGCASYDPQKEKVTDRLDGSHCVLSGHRGLPSAKLFSDLDKMAEGDLFTLNILNETLTYQVDQIRVVEPDDLSDLRIVKGKDLCTLGTCTPYGINSHRLLVRGRRVANAMGDVKVIADAMQIEPVFVAPFIAGPVLLLLVIWVLGVSGHAVRERKRRTGTMQKYLTDKQLDSMLNEKQENQEW
jgi:sortase A